MWRRRLFPAAGQGWRAEPSRGCVQRARQALSIALGHTLNGQQARRPRESRCQGAGPGLPGVGAGAGCGAAFCAGGRLSITTSCACCRCGLSSGPEHGGPLLLLTAGRARKQASHPEPQTLHTSLLWLLRPSSSCSPALPVVWLLLSFWSFLSPVAWAPLSLQPGAKRVPVPGEKTPERQPDPGLGTCRPQGHLPHLGLLTGMALCSRSRPCSCL